MGRIIFGAVLGVVALLYLWLVYQAVFTPGGFLQGGDLFTSAIVLIIFLAMGVAAAVGSINLLRQKGN